jgi:signal transduction histidine kinase
MPRNPRQSKGRERQDAFLAAILLIFIIAVADWAVVLNVSLAFLYVLPILLAAALLNRWWVVGLSLLCAGLSEALSPGAWTGGWILRLANTLTAYLGAGLFVSELVRRRRDTLAHSAALTEHVRLLEEENRKRETAEQQVRALIQGSPAAILAIDPEGNVALANDAAQGLLRRDGKSLLGEPIESYLPALSELRHTSRVRAVRTMMEFTGRRGNGSAFLAHAWVSSDGPPSETGMTAVLFDSSDDMRENEEARLHTLAVGARIAMGAFWHEARNLCSAMRVVIGNLKRIPHIAETEEILALGSLVGSLEQLASDELHPSSNQSYDICSLRVSLEHLRIMMEPALNEAGVEVTWRTGEDVPLVRAEPHGLLQVFVNMLRNAIRAMETVEKKQLSVRATAENDVVMVRFLNSGAPVENANLLFQPFQPGAKGLGVGLYVSRAIVRSFGGDLKYEPSMDGSCFTIILQLGDLGDIGKR